MLYVTNRPCTKVTLVLLKSMGVNHLQCYNAVKSSRRLGVYNWFDLGFWVFWGLGFAFFCLFVWGFSSGVFWRGLSGFG